MSAPQIRFDDGTAYEAFMGRWSLLAGRRFLDWLAPPAGLRWIDIGCGNGAFTELLSTSCAPADVQAIDPSEGQLLFARDRMQGSPVSFHRGDAMALPYPDAAFDAATMALVIFFVPDPVRGLAEMARVVRPGGLVAAYSWDFLGGGFPFMELREEMTALGAPPLLPPSVEASPANAMRRLWTGAGLVQVETEPIEVERTFADFDAYWRVALPGPPIAPRIAALSADDRERLRGRVRERLVPRADGTITSQARANAIRGRVPG